MKKIILRSIMTIMLLFAGICSFSNFVEAEEKSDIEGILVDYKVGNITAVNEEGIWLDGKEYSIDNFEDSFDLSEAARIWIEEQNKLVVLEFYNDKLHALYSANDIAELKLKIKTDPDKVVYQNGSFSMDSFTMNVELTYEIRRDYQFLPNSVRYSLYQIINQVKIKPTQDGLNFGENGFWFFKDQVTELVHDSQSRLSVGGSIKFSDTVYLDSGYCPNQINSFLGLEVTISTANSETITGYGTVEVGNLDLQQEQTEQKKYEVMAGTQLKKTQEELENCAAVALDANISHYFTPSQQDEIKKFLTVYMAEILTVDEMEDANIFEKITADMWKKARDKILSKLGVSNNVFVFFNSQEATVQISGITLSGEEETFEFVISTGSYSIGDASPYAGFGDIRYSIKDKNAVPDGASASGRGMITYADMESFANSMLDYLKVAYDQAWGKNANTIASMFVSKPFNDLMQGNYSGKLYKLMTDLGKSELKILSLHCPIDVYVYDSDNNLCGTIIDNKVDTRYQEIFLSVNGDDKSVFITGDDYKIEVIGTDTGTMEYTVEEYSDGESIRTVKTKNIPIEAGKKYISLVPDETLIDHDVYALCTEEGEIIDIDSDTYTEEIETPSQTVKSGKCGDNLTWEYYYANDLLVISGTGEMETFRFNQFSLRGETPWDGYSIKYLKIEDGVTTISDHAFRKHPELLTVELADSVQSIGDYAFWQCTGLNSIALGSKVSEIGNWVFSYCTSLHNIYVSDENPYFKSDDNILFSKNMTKIYKFPCNGISGYEIPSGVTVIGADAFGSNEQLQEVFIPESVTTIETSAFDGCTNLESINIPDNLESAGTGIFTGCTKLITAGPAEGQYNIKIELTEKIPEYLFSYSELITAVIPNTITELEERAFCGVETLETIELAGQLEVISDYAFYNCTSLAGIELPNALKSIGQHAFTDCSGLTSIIFPETLEKLRYSAFYNCSNLESAYFLSNAPLESDDAFVRVSEDFTIYVPANASGYDKYPWTHYKIVYVESSEYVKGDLNGDGEVEIDDLRTVLRVVCGKIELTSEQQLAADVETDGTVNIADLRKILRFVCGKIDQL